MRARESHIEAALRALAEAIESGLGVGSYLTSIAVARPPMFENDMGAAIKKAVKSGRELSFGFAQADVLTTGELALLRAGERRGDLGAALRALADGIAQRRADRQKLLMGLAYPVLIMTAAGCILPLPRIFFDSLAAYLAVAVWMPLLAVLGVVYALVVVPRLSPSSPARTMPRRVGLSIPLLGRALRRGAHGTFLEVLGKSLAAGLPAPMSLESAIIAANEPRLLDRRDVILGTLKKGGTLLESLAAADTFDASVLAAVGQGELTGKLEEVLPRTAKDEKAIARRAVMAVIAVLVVVVGIAVLSMVVVGLMQGVEGYFKTLDDAIESQTR